MNANANTIGIFTENVSSMYCPHCDAELDVSDFAVFEDIQCPSCQEMIKVPGRLGDFVLIDELGRGAMGCVYLAQDETLGRLVALKVLRKEFGEDPKMLDTVQREAKAMASLNHANICQVYSFGRADKQPYFVMELLTGERLDEVIADGNTISEIRALEIALDVARGLEAAEQAGLTHGDIKPGNILMNEKGVAKVVDFGLAKFMDPDAEIEVWGTPYYIAPEKARKKGEDSRSDQFSLGGTLFHALTGHPPFDAENPTKVVIASLKEETPILKEHNPGVTDKTSAVIRRMMDKNPNRRYPTYASLFADLELALTTAQEAEEQRRLEAARAEEKANKTVPLFVWIVLATLVTILLVGGGVFWMSQRQARLAQAVQYDGPDRELHQPFTKAEIRNLNQASEAMAERDIVQVEERLATARNLIPDTHSAMGWYKFFTAGLHIYAQDTESARAALREAVEIEEMLFDGGRVPREDPRVLAAYAIGDLDENDFNKALRKSEAYYRQLGELARGYRIVLRDGYVPASSRHFKRFAEYRIKGLEWPYVIQSLAKDLHLTRNKIEAGNLLDPRGEDGAGADATATDTPTGKPEKDIARATPTPKPSIKREEGLRNGLLALWTPEEEAPSPALGELIRDPGWDSDPENGKAMNFDGRSSGAEIESRVNFSRQRISFVFRLRPDSPDGSTRNIFSVKPLGDAAGNGRGNVKEGPSLFSIYTNGKGELEVMVGKERVNTDVLLPRAWVDVALVFDGTRFQDRLRVYLDGDSTPVFEGNVGSATRIPRSADVETLSAPDRKIGRWKGKIGGVAIFQRVLTPEEITRSSTLF